MADMTLAVSPAFATDRLVFAYVTTAQDNRIVRFRLGRIDNASAGAAAGYQDAFYFARQFKKVHGVTPFGYRGQRKG